MRQTIARNRLTQGRLTSKARQPVLRVISISGTPGTGKTTIARMLARHGASVIAIKSMLNEIPSCWDKERKTKIVDVKDLQRAVSKKIDRKRLNIIDGHLSHLLDADIVIVLRCRPDLLRKRLAAKKWGSSKIAENVMAEILGIIAAEALAAKAKKVVEIDTSRMKPGRAVDLVKKLLNNCAMQNKYRQRIDWTGRYAKELLK